MRIILILLIFITNIVIGQTKPFQYKIWVGKSQFEYLSTHYTEGTINLLNGESVSGLVNRDFKLPIIKYIDGEDTVSYFGYEIKDFKLKDESKVVSTTIDSNIVFLQEIPIEEGAIKVYTYDQIVKEEKSTSGGNYFTNPIEYNRIVEIVFEKDSVYRKLKSNDDVYLLIRDDKITMDYILKLGDIELNNLNKIVHIIEFYNISTN